MGLRGTAIPREYDSGAKLTDKWGRPKESVRTIWRFLRDHPYIFVVLVSDQRYQASTIRCGLLPISLGARIVGATTHLAADLRAACDSWMALYASGNPFVILDHRRELFPNSENSLISPSSAKGVDPVDLEHALHILQEGHRIVHDPSLTHEEHLLLAANLFFCGQTDLSKQLITNLIRKMGVEDTFFKPFEYGRRGDPDEFLFTSEPLPKMLYGVANMLGVRVSIALESSTNGAVDIK